MKRHHLLALLGGSIFSAGQVVGSVLRDDQNGRVWNVDAKRVASRAESRIAAASCSPGDRTYSQENPPVGKYMDWSYMNDNGISGATQYITIVNLTPHRFVLQSTHSYQLDVFDWGDVPQGHARQNTVFYTDRLGADDVDDNGEAYYAIEGTDKTFVVRATTHIPDDNPKRTVFDLTGMGLGQREYSDPATQAPVTLIITGSNDYGFTSSIRFGVGNWMKSIYDVIKDREIQHVVLPGSHDAGMSRISGQLLSFGSAANTQTQGINIHDQLRAGARWFDWRMGTIHDGDTHSFWTMHVNDELADVAVGNSGESIDEVVSEINQFTTENPGEVIFFRVRYLVGIRKSPSFGPIYWNTTMVNEFFDKLRGVNNRCGNLDTSTTFNHKPASYFMDQNEGRGCVIFLLAGDWQADVPQDSIPDGIYQTSQLSIQDYWSNMADTQPMADDQAAHWKAISRGGDSDIFHINQWLVSTDALEATFDTIQSIAVQPTNPALYWMGLNNMSPEAWPTVILTDYVGTVVNNQNSWDQLSADVYTLALGLNLYMISENCDVSHQRSPLLSALASDEAVRKHGFSAAQPPWRGIIYANGSVVDDAPRDFHLGRVSVLKSGTRFSNGTVLKEDVMNPDFRSLI